MARQKEQETRKHWLSECSLGELNGHGSMLKPQRTETLVSYGDTPWRSHMTLMLFDVVLSVLGTPTLTLFFSGFEHLFSWRIVML